MMMSSLSNRVTFLRGNVSNGVRKLLVRPFSDDVVNNKEEIKKSEESGQSEMKKLLSEEARGIFRVLDLGIEESERGDNKKSFSFNSEKDSFFPDRKFNPDIPWSSVWPSPKSFHPHVVPLPVRQGIITKKEKGDSKDMVKDLGVIPDKWANTELIKIPNFLHATPPAINQHCQAISKFTTKWPKELDDNPELMDALYPITESSSDYLNASSSIRDNRSRILTYRVKISHLLLNPKAKDKFIRLLGERYDQETDEALITVERCPMRKQNRDYFRYLISALYFESTKVEEWEKTAKPSYHDQPVFKYDEQDLPPNKDGDEFTQNQVTDEVKKVIEHLINEGENENTLAMVKDKVVSELFTEKF